MPTAITAQDFYVAMPGYTDCPEVMVNLHIESVDSKDDCLDKNYPTGTIKLIKFYYIAIMCSAAVGGQRRIKSQKAPNGASRSFDYYDPASKMTLEKAIKALDTADCVTGMLPESKLSVGVSGRRCSTGGYNSNQRTWRGCC